MAKKLLVEINGMKREMTQKAYDLIGFKRKPKIIGEVQSEPTEMEKLKADLIAKKAAGLPLHDGPVLGPTSNVPRETIVEQKPEEPKKKAGRPKSTTTE